MRTPSVASRFEEEGEDGSEHQGPSVNLLVSTRHCLFGPRRQTYNARLRGESEAKAMGPPAIGL
jgi:hypothetical protein